jgi:ABC-2 type transport system ATP-binding protein
MNTPVLQVKNIRKSYIPGKPVLRDVDFSVYPGETIGYIGPNGAGKSTTIKLILGLLPLDEGQITIFGQAVDPNHGDFKRRIGYVPEGGDLYENLSPAEFFDFLATLYEIPPKTVERRAKTMLEILGVEGQYHNRIASFSKGMKQKVLIVSSLIHNPDILILDEPLSGLDANSVTVFKEVLASLADQGKTIFYSSHIMEVVEKISDRIILLSDGRVAADGSLEDLRKQNHEASLETLFTDLTGFTDHESQAARFVAAMEDQA